MILILVKKGFIGFKTFGKSNQYFLLVLEKVSAPDSFVFDSVTLA